MSKKRRHWPVRLSASGPAPRDFIGLVPSELEVPVKRVTGELVKGADGTQNGI